MIGNNLIIVFISILICFRVKCDEDLDPDIGPQMEHNVPQLVALFTTKGKSYIDDWFSEIEGYDTANYELKCMGTLVSPAHVLTSASCLFDLMIHTDQIPLYAYVGGDISVRHVFANGSNENWAEVNWKVAHEQYEFKNKSSNDVAVVRLSKSFPNYFHVDEITIGPSEVGKIYYAYVYHKDGRLREVTFDIRQSWWCDELLRLKKLSNSRVTGSMFTFFHNGKQICGTTNSTYICLSDYGTPLMQRTIDSAGKFKNIIIVGIVSWSLLYYYCSYAFPTVFTDVHHYSSWINAKIHGTTTTFRPF